MSAYEVNLVVNKLLYAKAILTVCRNAQGAAALAVQHYKDHSLHGNPFVKAKSKAIEFKVCHKFERALETGVYCAEGGPNSDPYNFGEEVEDRSGLTNVIDKIALEFYEKKAFKKAKDLEAIKALTKLAEAIVQHPHAEDLLNACKAVSSYNKLNCDKVLQAFGDDFDDKCEALEKYILGKKTSDEDEDETLPWYERYNDDDDNDD